MIVQGGPHHGSELSQVPLTYLRWAFNHNLTDIFVVASDSSLLPMWAAAQAELNRRGARSFAVEITPHVIDRFTIRFLGAYIKNRQKDEGLFSFLQRVTVDLVNRGQTEAFGIKFVIDTKTARVPVLVTVSKKREKNVQHSNRNN